MNHDVLKAIRDAMVKIEKGNSNSLNSSCFIDDELKISRVINGPCYAGIGHNAEGQSLMVTRAKPGSGEVPPHQKQWVDYIANRSFLSQYITYYEDGYVVFDLNTHSISEIMNTAFAIRSGYEYNSAEMFSKILEKENDERLAFILSLFIKFHRESIFFVPGSGHTVLSPSNMTVGSVKTLYHHGIIGNCKGQKDHQYFRVNISYERSIYPDEEKKVLSILQKGGKVADPKAWNPVKVYELDTIIKNFKEML